MERLITCKDCGNVYPVTDHILTNMRCPRCSSNHLQFSCDVELRCFKCGNIQKIRKGQPERIIHCTQYLHEVTFLASTGNAYIPPIDPPKVSEKVVETKVEEKPPVARTRKRKN